MEPAVKTPLLHHKLEQILEAEDLFPGSHDYKAAVELFEIVPQGRAVPGIQPRSSALGRGAPRAARSTAASAVSCAATCSAGSVTVVVALPRDRFSADASQAAAETCSLRALPRRQTVDYHLSLGETESGAALLHGARRRRRADPRGRRRGARSRRSSASPAPGTTTCSTRWCASRRRRADGRSPRTVLRRGSPTTTSRHDTDWRSSSTTCCALEELEPSADGVRRGHRRTRRRANVSRA